MAVEGEGMTWTHPKHDSCAEPSVLLTEPALRTLLAKVYDAAWHDCQMDVAGTDYPRKEVRNRAVDEFISQML